MERSLKVAEERGGLERETLSIHRKHDLTKGTGRAKRSLRSERGAALVEFSIAAVLFLGLIYGAVSYGVVFWVKSTITHAAAEGARAAVGKTGAAAITAAQDTAVDIKNKTLPAAYKNHAIVDTATTAACAGDPTATCLTITVRYPYKDHPIVPALPPIFPILPNELKSTSVIQIS